MLCLDCWECMVQFTAHKKIFKQPIKWLSLLSCNQLTNYWLLGMLPTVVSLLFIRRTDIMVFPAFIILQPMTFTEE
jgi:hypothetical protein